MYIVLGLFIYGVRKYLVVFTRQQSYVVKLLEDAYLRIFSWPLCLRESEV